MTSLALRPRLFKKLGDTYVHSITIAKLTTSRKIKSPILQILRYEAVISFMPEIIQLGLNFLANREMNKNTPVISLGCFYSFLNC